MLPADGHATLASSSRPSAPDGRGPTDRRFGTTATRAAGAVDWIRPAALTRVLFAATAVLTLLHVAAAYLRHGLGYDYAKGAVPLFDFNTEANAPTWFSSSLLFTAGAVAALIALRSARMRGHWAAVAAVATFLSFDESVQLHELVTVALRSALAVGSGFSLAVVAMVSLLPVLLGAALFYRFMRALRRRTAAGLLLAAGIYLTGAVGIDTIASFVAFSGGDVGVDLALNTVEELFEMSGVIVAIHVLLTHLLHVAAFTDAPADARAAR